MRITKHAAERTRERAGLKRKALERMAAKALEDGLTHAEAKGPLKDFVSNLYLKHRTANGVRIYGEFVFIFCGHTLVTVFRLPNSHLRLANKLWKRKRAALDQRRRRSVS